MNTRYPGIRPFERNDQSVFFGRDADILQLSRLIRLEKLVVLNGKSGLGKSSLLHAGVMPELEHLGYDLHSVRLGAYDPSGYSEYSSPYQTLYTHLKGVTSFLGDRVETPDSLWMLAKHRQLLGKTGKAMVLVLDQFEELFTWPPVELDRFKAEFSALVNLEMPADLAQTLRITPQHTFSDSQWEDIYSPLQIKVVMAIRSDRLSRLNQFADQLPDILGKIYELNPLDRESARSAILLPARQKGEFDSPPFTYSTEAQETILDSLSDDFQERVESFQLQLVCQYIEDYVVPSEAKDFVVQPQALPPIEEIFSNYYNRQVQRLGNARDQHNARRFIEEGLILEEEERRLSLFEGVIRRRYGISEVLLEQLVASRLIRAEPLAEGGYTYELAHDTLVPPILEAKQARKLAQQRRRWSIGAALGLAVIAGLTALTLWINNLRLDAEDARDDAKRAERQADSLRQVAEKSDRIARKNLTLATQNLERAKASDSLAKLRAKDAIAALERESMAKAETQVQLDALREANRRRVEELIGGVPTAINQLDFEKGRELVLQAIDIGAAAKKSLWAASELIFYYSEIQKPSVVWPLYLATQTLEKDPTFDRHPTDSVQQLLSYIQILFPLDSLKLIERKYYPFLREVEGGSFEMGNDELDRLFISQEGVFQVPEIALHKVSISTFEIAESELTVLQYRLYCESTGQDMPDPPSWGFEGDNPMISVSWWDAVRYANWLSEKRGLTPVYDFSESDIAEVHIKEEAEGFRLPTEAEWEFASGGGMQGRITGRKRTIFAGSDTVNLVGWYLHNSGGRTQGVCLKDPNELGLYDMSGNIWEWCQDWYGPYSKDPSTDPNGIEFGLRRVLRGGSWESNASLSRVSSRGREYPNRSRSDIGFRLARDRSR